MAQKNWVKLKCKMKAEEIVKFGPSLSVEIKFGGGWHPVLAQIDSGANHSCVSPRLIEKEGAEAVGKRLQQVANHDAADTPIDQGSVKFPTGTQFEHNFAALSALSEPHDVLVGRDLLQYCRLRVDFTTGQIKLQFKVR